MKSTRTHSHSARLAGTLDNLQILMELRVEPVAAKLDLVLAR